MRNKRLKRKSRKLPLDIEGDLSSLPAIEQLVRAKAAENVRYMELRWGPHLHTAKGLTQAEVIAAGGPFSRFAWPSHPRYWNGFLAGPLGDQDRELAQTFEQQRAELMERERALGAKRKVLDRRLMAAGVMTAGKGGQR